MRGIIPGNLKTFPVGTRVSIEAARYAPRCYNIARLDDPGQVLCAVPEALLDVDSPA